MSKILIIEDDQIVANIYRNKLTVDGYTVETAADGIAGLEMLHRFKPDVVLLDLLLPKLSGVELMKRARAFPEFKSLPIIVFSNTYLTNMIQEAWRAGATKCLSKASCSPKQLLEIVRTTLAANAGAAQRASISGPPSKPAAAASTKASAASASLATGASAPAEASPAALRKSLLDTFPATLSALRASLQALIKASDNTARLRHLDEMHRRIHVLTGTAAVTDLPLIATVSDALEALLHELHNKPKTINASTLRTVAGAIDFLGALFGRGRSSIRQDIPAAKILVVDDEPISRRAIVSALERAKLKANAVEDPETAYTLLSGSKYDLIFLDIDMPGMTGHELCAKLRALPDHQKTPVVFVTGLNGFEARANAMMSGGNDFIAKPFIFLELAVKALVYILGNHLDKPHSPHSLQPV